MAEKKVTGFVKLQIPAGAANPAPPVGPALGAQGVNIMQFCQAFNAATQEQSGTIIPVEITIYEDKTFTFVCKTPPAAVLIKEKLGIKSGSGIPQLKTVGTLSLDQLREIAEIKMPDLNANDIEAAMEIVAGTARSMGRSHRGPRDEEGLCAFQEARCCARWPRRVIFASRLFERTVSGRVSRPAITT